MVMDNARLVRVSKYLSKHLRHQPERLGLRLGPGGWVKVGELLAACRANNFPISRAELNEVIERNDKRRFALDETGSRIRASQGHSIKVDLQLRPVEPPPVLYHGTNESSAASIMSSGLSKMARHHVHLSPDVETALRVGSRRGRPVVFRVDAAAMAEAGHQFFVSDNGVWLVDEVPPEFLELL